MNPQYQKMMKQVQEMQRKMAQAQEELANETVEASAGGGMVTAEVNGRLDLVDIAIDPQVADDVDLLEDMVKAAVGQAMDKARDLQREGMSKLLVGLPLPPGLETLLGQ